MNTNWEKLILKNFDQASPTYKNVAGLQQIYAMKLANHCAQKSIPSGLWVDLGSGTGLLANELERIDPQQSVLRIDGSKKMLMQHPRNKPKKLFNLNSGLPNLIKPPTLIASNFVLHWLDHPEEKLKEWFSVLPNGGWLAITYPVHGSFPEWHEAAKAADVTCTALPLPSKELLLNTIKKEYIQFESVESFTQEAPQVTSLLKQFIEFGAQTTPYASLKVSEWRKLKKSWPISKSTHFKQLTWLIQILLAKK